MAKIIINKNYFAGLSKGTHTLRVNFKDGYAEGDFEVGEKITFMIEGQTFTATSGQTWAEWMQSFEGSNTSGNGIIWVSRNNELFLDILLWDNGLPMESWDNGLFDANDNRQTLNDTIISGASYGRPSGGVA